VLSVPPLQPGDEALDELGVATGPLVDHGVLLLVGQAFACGDLLPNGEVEELQPGPDEPLDRPPVEPRKARELVVVGRVERGDNQLQHLRILVAKPVVLGRRKAELAPEPSQQLRVAAELGGEPFVGRRRLDRLGQEEPEREGELAGRNPARDIVERDADVLESHEAHDVDVRGLVEPIVLGPRASRARSVAQHARPSRGQGRRPSCAWSLATAPTLPGRLVYGPYHLPATRLRVEKDDSFPRELTSGLRAGEDEVPSHGLNWVGIRRSV
jgi:hypothetical protein